MSTVGGGPECDAGRISIDAEARSGTSSSDSWVMLEPDAWDTAPSKVEEATSSEVGDAPTSSTPPQQAGTVGEVATAAQISTPEEESFAATAMLDKAAMLKLCHTLNSVEPLAGDEKITKDPTGGRERRPWGVWERRVALAVLLLSSHAAAFLIGAAVGGRKVSSSTDSPLTRRYSSGPYNSSTPWLSLSSKSCLS